MPPVVSRLADAGFNSTGAPPGAAPSALPPGIDLDKTPEEVRAIMTYIQGVLKEKGSEILQYAVNKANPDRSFLDPKTVANLDISKLTDEQKALYYVELARARNVSSFLENQYGDSMYVYNETTGKETDKGDIGIVVKDIDARLKQLEDLGISKVLGSLVNNNVGNWLKENDHIGYATIQSTFDIALFGFNGKAGLGADKYKDMPFTDALTSLNTTALLARTYLATDDFKEKSGDLNKTYYEVMNGQLKNAAGSRGDFDVNGKESSAPPPSASMEEFNTWYNSLSDSSVSKTARPLIEEAFNQSEIATKLKEAGYKEGTDVWETYKHTYFKDATTLYNNVWGGLRKEVKLDSLFKDTIVPGEGSVMRGVPSVAGVTDKVYRSGLMHTVQNVTLAAGIATSIVGAQGAHDPQTIMSLTYASTNLADMLVETGVKYIDPKGGGFQALGLNKDGKWTQAVSKYVPIAKVEAAAKMLVGAGSVVAGAASIWSTVNAVKNGDTAAAVLNSINGAGSVISGLATGIEGVLQWTNIMKNFAEPFYGPAIAKAIDATARAVLASVGWAAGLIAGLGLTALGLYDMAKGAKVLGDAQKEAERTVAPTTGWTYHWVSNPDPSFTW
jgi:hypothetical protein